MLGCFESVLANAGNMKKGKKALHLLFWFTVITCQEISIY